MENCSINIHKRSDTKSGCCAARPLSIAILGATGHIGAVLCRTLAAQGHQLMLGARNEAQLANRARQCGARSMAIDATKSGAIEYFLHAAVGHYGRLDGVVNCIGALWAESSRAGGNDDWLDKLAINLTTAFSTVDLATRSMMQQNPAGGSIVLVSSVVGPGVKGGIHELALTSAATYGRHNIRCNVVAPFVATPSMVSTPINSPENQRYDAEEVAASITWLLQPEQSRLSGHVVHTHDEYATLNGHPEPVNIVVEAQPQSLGLCASA
jgi:3-oxoacyl-[acyl-carrier protein] reductase